MSAITTVAILVVYVAMWPMKGIIDDIRVGPIIYLLSTLPSTFLLGRGIFSPYGHPSQRNASR